MDCKAIPYDTVDGADPSNKDRRNELFGISGRRGAYPQFFLVHGSTTTFWGDWDRLESCNEDGTLETELIGEKEVEETHINGDSNFAMRGLGTVPGGSVWW